MVFLRQQKRAQQVFVSIGRFSKLGMTLSKKAKVLLYLQKSLSLLKPPTQNLVGAC